ncbi:MAG: hypothetical protein ACRYF2_16840 [Janthinobacterium lividum]
MSERFVVERHPLDDHQSTWLEEFEQLGAAFRMAVNLAQTGKMVLLQLPYSVDGQLMSPSSPTAYHATDMIDRHNVSEQNELSTECNLVGLDSLIMVTGEYTTIRNEHNVGYVTALRVDDVPVAGHATPGHWILIDRQSFPVSARDHAFLRGEPFPPPI